MFLNLQFSQPYRACIRPVACAPRQRRDLDSGGRGGVPPGVPKCWHAF
jgi:hypothetical protein